MQDNYKVTSQEIVSAAESLLGTRFRHQGRSAETGLDCVGFLLELAKRISYPYTVFDKATYRRVPNEELALEYLRRNMDEIAKSDIATGDVISMMSGGREVHVGVKVSDTQFIHARNKGGFSGSVQKDYLKHWENLFVRGFRIKGAV